MAGALLDITDPVGMPGTSNEGGDYISAGFWRLWRIIRQATEPNAEHSYWDFYLHWSDYSDGSGFWGITAPILIPGYQNTIEYPAVDKQHNPVTLSNSAP